MRYIVVPSAGSVAYKKPSAPTPQAELELPMTPPVGIASHVPVAMVYWYAVVEGEFVTAKR
jgi:hypothetical protein